MTVYIYDPEVPPELPPLPIGALAVGIVNLLQEAASLPQPHYITISDTQYVSLQFSPEPSSFRAITRWALRFGGVVASEPRQTERGPQIWCRVNFDYYGVRVCAYAHIPAGTAR